MTLPEPLIHDEAIDVEAEKRAHEYRRRVVSDRLEAWIEFHRRRNDLDVKGYPEMPIYERMAGELEAMKRKGRAIKRGETCRKAWACMIHSTYSGRSWDAELETDAAVRALPGSIRKFLKIHYLEAGTVEMKAARLVVTKRTYEARIEIAMRHLITWGQARGWFTNPDY